MASIPLIVYYLSWNSARLIALVLNALNGLENYYADHLSDINVDGLFGLRIIHGQLKHLYMDLEGSDLDVELIQEMRNLSERANELANKAIPYVADRDPFYYRQFHYLLLNPYDITYQAQRTDERLRWMHKELLRKKFADLSEIVWFNEKQSDRCFAEVLSKDYNVENMNSTCTISELCLKQMFATRGLSEYRLAHQIIFAAITLITPCSGVVSEYLSATSNQTINEFISEYCTNLLDEMLAFQKNARILARMNTQQKDLLMEQVFACGQFGFVETCSLHVLVAILSWQNPISGCYMTEIFGNQFHNNNNHISSASSSSIVNNFTPRKVLNDIIHDDYCSTHSATVASGALVVFLRFLFMPGPWPEFHLANQAVPIHNIAAEDQFRQYNYASWVRNTLPLQIPLSKPPHVGWSPDLLAYLLLIVIVCIASISSQLCCKRRVKQIYHFAYKNL